MLGINKLHFDLRIWMASTAAMHDEMNITPFFIHVTQPRRGVMIAAALGWKMNTHEGLKLALRILARSRLAQKARFRLAPTRAFAEAVAVVIWRLPLP